MKTIFNRAVHYLEFNCIPFNRTDLFYYCQRKYNRDINPILFELDLIYYAYLFTSK